MTEARKKRLLQVIAKRQADLAVVLENVFDPHNISAVMRSCDAVGVQELYVLNTRIPRHRKWGFKSSSSASKWLTVHQFDDPDSCFEVLRSRYGRILTTYLDEQSTDLYEVDFTLPTAMVFGNEHAGVSPEIRARADGNFAIPQTGIIKSLNISVACAVSLYEAQRQKRLAGHYNGTADDSPYKQALQQQWGLAGS